MTARMRNEEFQDYFEGDPGPSTRQASIFSGRSQSPDEDAESAVKKRKVSRACDVCRKRKVRCDFVQLPSGNLQKCLNCFSNKIECTFTEDNKPRRTSKNYVQSLEQKVERTEKLLELLCPDARLREEMLEGNIEDIPVGAMSPRLAQQVSEIEVDKTINIEAIAKAVGRTPLDLTVLMSRIAMYRRYPPEHSQQPDERQVDEEDIAEADHLTRITQEQLRIKEEESETDHFVKPFYFGKSSARAMLAQLIKVKNESRSERSASVSTTSSGKDVETESDAASGLDVRMSSLGPGEGVGGSPAADSVSEATDDHGPCKPQDFMGMLRPEFWQILPWEKKAFRMSERQRNTTTQFSFPERSLLQTLVDYYFKYINIELPLLHRPTFERDIEDGLHHRDAAFGSTVLLVCAIGSRYSDDPRVQISEAEALNASEEERAFMAQLRPKDDKESRSTGTGAVPQARSNRPGTYHARGWKFFDQAWKAMNNLLIYSPPTLYDLQFYSLATEYLRGTSLPQASWVMVGIGIRLGQDIGAHRKRMREPSLEPELAKQEELRKRAFWVLVSLDRLLSSATGRPCAIQDESFDLDDPVECDDEYWETSDPDMLFKQPEGKPSLMTAFVLLIRLNQILATCLRTIYSSKKGHALRGLLRLQWRDRVVSEIDSVLNKWLDIVPPHLRWDTPQPNDDFFMQSANLHAAYYYMQILVHRPFIPSPSNPIPPVELPSLAICTHAARSIIHIGLAQLERVGEVSSTMPLQLLGASVVLLLRMWEDRRTGKLTEQMFKLDMDNLNSCLKILDIAERRWFSAGKLRDLLHSLIPENGMYGTVAAEFSNKVQQRLNAHAKSKAPTARSSPLSTPSPFAPPAGKSSDAFQQPQPPSHASSSKTRMSPPSTTNTFASPSSQNVTPSSSHRQAPAATAHLSGTGAAPSADPNAQWSMFATGPDFVTPQQSMFADQRQSGNAWAEPSGFYQPQSESRPQQGHQRQNLSFEQVFATQSEGSSALFNPNMFSLDGLNDFSSSNDFGMSASSSTFVPAPSPYWPGATMLGPNPAASDASGNTSPSMYDDWNYLSGLVDLSSRNELLDQLFPHHAQAGFSSGPPV